MAGLTSWVRAYNPNFMLIEDLGCRFDNLHLFRGEDHRFPIHKQFEQRRLAIRNHASCIVPLFDWNDFCRDSSRL